MNYRFPISRQNICTHILTFEIEKITYFMQKNHFSGFHLHEARHAKQGLWNNPEGQYRKECGGSSRMGGTPIYLWLINVDAWQKPSRYCVVINPQLNF